MIRLSRILFAAALLAAPFAASAPADAATIVMCRAAASGASPGPGRWTAPASGTSYSLDNQGCALINVTDIGDAAAGSFTQSGPVRAVALKGISSTPASLTLPASAVILRIVAEETSGTAIVGGFSIGKTSGATDVTVNATLGASSIAVVSDTSLTLKAFSATVPQALFFNPFGAQSGGTLINSAVNLTVLYSFF